MSTAVLAQFAMDPMASHSAQFPLGAPYDRVSYDEPSCPDVRPWALRGMRTQPRIPAEVARTVRYDHRMQLSVDVAGSPVIEAGPPTVKNKTNLDGDEGPSEDFSYDFVPDEPFQV
ncbi:putative ATP-grasp target RiPP [Tamaricihabitans halophyticus]|uniref:Putative ATP-grasp target RiPP n=1 Tax=Tamaricihabitans halophyticus TaxID=1262583 RepID=A0A4R2Q9H6_9PSEU|nr:putative ATP-grasp-modified RiPP [Tamaricihabitans halophyticus]TCP43405.1 putative ATP-grasp target RiPP [Tamaricihabitans halophyticus]